MRAEETEETGDGSLFPKKQRERRTVPCYKKIPNGYKKDTSL
jgi:hypothetical protein